MAAGARCGAGMARSSNSDLSGPSQGRKTPSSTLLLKNGSLDAFEKSVPQPLRVRERSSHSRETPQGHIFFGFLDLAHKLAEATLTRFAMRSSRSFIAPSPTWLAGVPPATRSVRAARALGGPVCHPSQLRRLRFPFSIVPSRFSFLLPHIGAATARSSSSDLSQLTSSTKGPVRPRQPDFAAPIRHERHPARYCC